MNPILNIKTIFCCLDPYKNLCLPYKTLLFCTEVSSLVQRVFSLVFARRVHAFEPLYEFKARWGILSNRKTQRLSIRVLSNKNWNFGAAHLASPTKGKSVEFWVIGKSKILLLRMSTSLSNRKIKNPITQDLSNPVAFCVTISPKRPESRWR